MSQVDVLNVKVVSNLAELQDLLNKATQATADLVKILGQVEVGLEQEGLSNDTKY